MAGKREKPEDIVMKLRQVEGLRGRGMSVADPPLPPARVAQINSAGAKSSPFRGAR